MAIKFDSVEVTRGEELRLYPEDIIVDADANGRANLDDAWVAGHSPESIQEMVDSYNRMGQQQPVQIRKVAGKPKLVSGHRRWAGAMEYNRQHPDARMKLRCTLTNLNDEEAFERNVEENTVRSGLTPMDQAYNHRRFREMLGWTDSRIADRYKINPTYVCQLKQLLDLDRETQRKVHSRELSVEAALLIVGLSSEERKQVMAEVAPAAKKDDETFDLGTVTEANGEETKPAKPKKVSTAAVRRAVRKKKAAKGGKVARTLSEVREFFEALTGPAESKAVQSFSLLMMNFIGGRVTDEDMEKELNRLFTDSDDYADE